MFLMGEGFVCGDFSFLGRFLDVDVKHIFYLLWCGSKRPKYHKIIKRGTKITIFGMSCMHHFKIFFFFNFCSFPPFLVSYHEAQKGRS